jgi:murein DD-endopeptidase MepM/ murein hydrolase activator NlpD
MADRLKPLRPPLSGSLMPFRRPLVLAALLVPSFAQAGTLPRHDVGLLSPVKSACVSSPFGPRVLPNRPLAGTYHYGIDMPAPAGEAVRATASGKVIRIQHKGAGGLEVLVQHDGFVGVYSHLGMLSPALAEGKATLPAGEQIGIIGLTGVTYGMHLYFEKIAAGRPVDPAPYLGVPLCNGGIHRTRADTLGPDGKIPPTRHYARFS